MADVFISYKRTNRAWAERISAALQDAGLSCWWDTSLVAGEHFNQAIDRELGACRCVLVIWSQAAHDSRWVQAEAIQGFDRGILLAANIEDVRLGYPFSLVDSMDLRQADLDALVSSVRAKLGEATSQRRRRFKLTLPFVASVLCLAASAALLYFGLLQGIRIDSEEPLYQAGGIAAWVLGGIGAIALFEVVSRRSSLAAAFGGAGAALAAFAGSLALIVAATTITGAEDEAYASVLLAYPALAALFSALFAVAVRRQR